MLRCALPPQASWASRIAWRTITHAGGAGALLLAVGLPAWLACCTLQRTSQLALLTLVVSHLLVQLIKRTVVRRRPGRSAGCATLVEEPDPFSFPSGHATASMSVALVYGSAFTLWAAPLVLLALLVGFSRVRLGVHYPSDVLVGQLIAAGTAIVLAALRAQLF